MIYLMYLLLFAGYWAGYWIYQICRRIYQICRRNWVIGFSFGAVSLFLIVLGTYFVGQVVVHS